MNTKKLGQMLMILGFAFAVVAIYYAYQPYSLRWKYADVIGRAILRGGYSDELGDWRFMFAVFEERKRNFGIAAAVTTFIGFAIVYSSKGGSTRKCSFCAEEIQIEAMLCKHCGKEQPSLEHQEQEKAHSAGSRRNEKIETGAAPAETAIQEKLKAAIDRSNSFLKKNPGYLICGESEWICPKCSAINSNEKHACWNCATGKPQG